MTSLFRWLCALCICAVHGGWAECASADELRVMSFNIRYGTANDGENHWNLRKEFLVETIRQFAPDLLGTQETLGFQKDYLAEALPGYEAFGVGRDHGDERGEMTAVLFRKERFEMLSGGHFWLSETPDVPGSVSWDSSLTRMVTWLHLRDLQAAGQPEFYLFNTHFDHVGREARIESARLLKKTLLEMTGDGPALVLGDFNTGEGTLPYLVLFDGDDLLRDTYRIMNPEPGSDEGTFNNFRADQTRGARIDWIGCTQHWRVTAAGIDRTARDGRTPSDHFPVTAVLQWERDALDARQ